MLTILLTVLVKLGPASHMAVECFLQWRPLHPPYYLSQLDCA